MADAPGHEYLANSPASLAPSGAGADSSQLSGVDGDIKQAFGNHPASKNLRDDLLSAADNVTCAMSSLVKELNSGNIAACLLSRSHSYAMPLSSFLFHPFLPFFCPSVLHLFLLSFLSYLPSLPFHWSCSYCLDQGSIHNRKNTRVLYKSDPCFYKFTPIWIY